MIRQLLTESTVLALLGSACGLLIAAVMIQLIEIYFPLPSNFAIEINPRVLAYGVLVTAIAAVLTGLVPALWLPWKDLMSTLQASGRSVTATRSSRRVQQGLIALQAAAALTLLTGAGLMTESFLRLSHVETGYNAHNLLTLDLHAAAEFFPDAEQPGALAESVLNRLQTLPGVESAGFAGDVPTSRLGRETQSSYGKVVTTDSTESKTVGASFAAASEQYLQALQIDLQRGRFIGPADRRGAAPIVVINETFARRLWGAAEPVGKTVQLGGHGSPVYTVVGVVADTRRPWIGGATNESARAYLPAAQGLDRKWTMYVRFRSLPSDVEPAVRRAVEEVSPWLRIGEILSMEEWDALFLRPVRSVAQLTAVFAAFALLLAAVGVQSVVSQAVTQRTREIGLRIALGSQRAPTALLVLRGVLSPIMLGLLLGSCASLLLARALSSLLYAVSPTAPFPYLGAAFLLVTGGLVFSLPPMLRAIAVDPLVAMRSQ